MATPGSPAARRTPGRGRAQTTRTVDAESSTLMGIPTKYHPAIFIGLILLSLLIFFGGVIFSGELFVATDLLSWESFRPYLNSMDAKGEPPLWLPNIFSGLPAFAAYLVTGDRWWDLIMKLIYSTEHIFGLPNYLVMRVVMHYFIYGIGMYLLMRSKKAARTTSLFVALAAIFSTWIIIYIMIGHNTKIMVLMTFPYVFLCLEKLIDRWSLLYAGLLIAAVHVMAEANHLQTAFYGAMAVGIYLLFELVAALVTREKLAGVIRAGLLTILAAAFAFGMGMDRNLAVQEYVPYSTRGAPSIVDTANAQAGDDGSHGYEYATNWSFSPEEVFTFLVPSYFGWGKLEYGSASTGAEPEMVPTYWGQMPFTDAGHYAGIAVLILGIFGAWMNRRNRFVQAMTVIGLFGLFLSFGKNFSILYDPFYNLVPNFNKFRAPSQSLVLLEMVLPILAGFGIETLLAMRRAGVTKGTQKSILYAAAGFGVFFLIGVTGLIKESYISAVASSAQAQAQRITPDHEFIYSTMATDWAFSALFGIATLLVMYYYVQGKMSPTAFKLALFGILIFDLWRVDYRPMETQPKEIVEQVHAATDVDMFLKADTSRYRILDLTVQGPNYPAYHGHEHIMGYHSAKLRNYQDLLDVAGNGDVPTSPLAWNLLNTKYIIYTEPIGPGLQPVFQSQQKKAIVFENTAAMPRAWFVNRLEVAKPKEILEKIRDNAFDPRDVAFVDTLPAEPIQAIGYVPGTPADTTLAGDTTTAGDTTGTARTPTAGTTGGGSVQITRYEPLRISMNVEAPGRNFLVISEVNYSPGWRATIDGQPAPIIRTNYLLRGLIVPPGKHTIEMTYVSEGFQTGKWVSLGLNLLTIGAIVGGIVLERKRKHPEEADPRHDAPVIAEDDV